MAALCEFGGVAKDILAQIIQGCCSSRVCRKALKDYLNLELVLDEAQSFKLSESRAYVVQKTVSVNAVLDDSTTYAVTV